MMTEKEWCKSLLQDLLQRCTRDDFIIRWFNALTLFLGKMAHCLIHTGIVHLSSFFFILCHTDWRQSRFHTVIFRRVSANISREKTPDNWPINNIVEQPSYSIDFHASVSQRKTNCTQSPLSFYYYFPSMKHGKAEDVVCATDYCGYK